MNGLVGKAFDGGKLRGRGSASSDWNVARNSGSLERDVVRSRNDGGGDV